MPDSTRAPTGQTPVWLTEAQVAGLLNVSLSKLRSDRQKVRGISYVKFGRVVRYAFDDVRNYVESHKIQLVNRS